jgi:hypothetical protein
MNIDPFNEFGHLRKRQEIQFDKLKEVRHQIDSRVGDSEIMMLIDFGVDAVALCRDKIKEFQDHQQQELFNDAYHDAIKTYSHLHSTPPDKLSSIGNFIHACKTDDIFSKLSTIEFEKRILSLEERGEYYESNYKGLKRNKSHEDFDEMGIPKLIVCNIQK